MYTLAKFSLMIIFLGSFSSFITSQVSNRICHVMYAILLCDKWLVSSWLKQTYVVYTWIHLTAHEHFVNTCQFLVQNFYGRVTRLFATKRKKQSGHVRPVLMRNILKSIYYPYEIGHVYCLPSVLSLGINFPTLDTLLKVRSITMSW